MCVHNILMGDNDQNNQNQSNQNQRTLNCTVAGQTADSQETPLDISTSNSNTVRSLWEKI